MTSPLKRRLLVMVGVVLSAGVWLMLRQPEAIPQPSVAEHIKAGDSAMRSARYEDALEHFHAVLELQDETTDEELVTAMFSSAEVCRALGRMVAAEQHYMSVLDVDPKHLATLERLAFVLDLQGRRWEARRYLLKLLELGSVSFDTLIRLATRESAIPYPDELARLRALDSESVAVKMADATGLLAHNVPGAAEPLLRQIVDVDTEMIEAHARLGLLLADGDSERLPQWNSQVAKSTETHPDVWVARGLWAQRLGRATDAIWFFARATKLDPDQRVANYQLAQLLNEFDVPVHANLAARFAMRAKLLQELAASVNRLSLDRNNLDAMSAAGQTLEKLGRDREANAWYGLALDVDPRRADIRARQNAIDSEPRNSVIVWIEELDLPEAAPSLPSDVSNIAQHNVEPRIVADANITFADRAEEVGLRFAYFNGHEQITPGMKMYAFAGGGIGILDYDQDGFSDVYLVQGCRWPTTVESTEYRDRLFRNVDGLRFEDVTDHAGLGDGWFGQGVSIGDWDNDGWPDIYVANIGRNRLYRNSGDGSFQDVTDAAGITGEQWTVSCLLADIDGDTNPDIYDVNYLRGEDLFDRLCSINGQLRACVPGVFAAERDRIYLNSSDGRFAELLGEQANALASARAGMGIVAADFTGSGQLSLFVANDVTANTLLSNTAAKDAPLQLEDDALLSGLAFDRDGRAQACMGVAADDVDGNGLIDLLVTNYYEEANSLYLQINPGEFIEASRQMKLFQPSFRELGFGAQFLDANLDGWMDLVVANGHLDDFAYMNHPFRMRAQLFINLGGKQFVAANPERIGDYFERKQLGRSMALVDWNRDGRADVVVSHLDQPVALVTNTSEASGHWLKLRLHGVTSCRDAIGTTVSVKSGDRIWTKQLTAGSGYQASNERTLLFGLADSQHVDAITVTWPSGLKQEFRSSAMNAELGIVEGADRLFELP